jgi:hypothetical protein
MLRRVEAVEIGQQEAGGVAHAPVGIGHALEDLVGDAHLAAIIGRRDPQAQDVGAQRLDHFLRRDHVAQRLRHLAALGVHGEAVGQHALVRAQPRASPPRSAATTGTSRDAGRSLPDTIPRGNAVPGGDPAAAWVVPESNQTSRVSWTLS